MSASWKPKMLPWEPADVDERVVYAIRALRSGEAMEHQQILAWDWLMYLTGAGDGYADMSFRPGADGARATDFAEGKRFVGLQLMKMMRPEMTPKIVKK